MQACAGHFGRGHERHDAGRTRAFRAMTPACERASCLRWLVSASLRVATLPGVAPSDMRRAAGRTRGRSHFRSRVPRQRPSQRRRRPRPRPCSAQAFAIHRASPKGRLVPRDRFRRAPAIPPKVANQMQNAPKVEMVAAYALGGTAPRTRSHLPRRAERIFSRAHRGHRPGPSASTTNA